MVYAAGAVLCALSQDAGVFYLSRAVQGFGYAFVNPVLVAILAEVVPPESRGRNMGFLAAATTAGVACGPLIAGIMSQWDWRYTFVLIAVLCIICNAAILATYKGQGFLSSGASMRSMRPNLTRTLKDHGVILISAIGFLNFFCYIGALSYVSDILAKPPLDLTGGEIGAMVALTGMAGIFAAPFGGFLVERIGRATTASLGLYGGPGIHDRFVQLVQRDMVRCIVGNARNRVPDIVGIAVHHDGRVHSRHQRHGLIGVQ